MLKGCSKGKVLQPIGGDCGHSRGSLGNFHPPPPTVIFL
jgi:hypothetical protein